MVEVPSGPHAANVVDGSRDGRDGRKNEERVGAVVGEVGEQGGGTEADQNQEGSAEQRTFARVENRVNHEPDF